MILFHMALARPSRPARARGRASRASSCATSGPAQEHAIAFDEEAYSLGLSPRLRVRHRRHPLHLLLDDDAERDLRLRPAHPRARLCASARRCRAATIRRAYVTRRLFATAPDGEQVPISLLHRRGLAARRLGAAASSTATAPTAPRCRPASAPTCSRSSTAASSTPSPMSAAARRRAGAGTRRQAREEAQHLHRLHRLRASA